MRTAAALLGLTLLAATSQAAAAPGADILEELNWVRANPAAFAGELRARAAQADDYADPTFRDRAAVREAIAFLEDQRPLAPITSDGRIAAAALEHVQAQGPTGAVGHGAAGSLGRRMQSHGVWAGLSAEAISYGQNDATDVITQLVIDSGVPGRGHRNILFSPTLTVAGAACGRHAEYQSMCVIDFAGAIPAR